MLASTFLDFTLPNASTWFYFSALLAVALFFKFTRLLSMRNFDVILLYALVPGLLIVQEARGLLLTMRGVYPPDPAAEEAARRWLWGGYLWLFIGSGVLFFRCLFDLALVRRPALNPNLNLAGMAWLAGALFFCLVAVAVRRPIEPNEKFGKSSVILTQVERSATAMAQYTPAGRDARFWVERGLAIACHLAVVIALMLIGGRHFGDIYAGMAAATLYLLMPFTAVHIAQVHHVLPAALLVWAVYHYRRPDRSGLLVGLACGAVFFPLVTLPIWISFYWGRGLRAFLRSFGLTLLLSLALAALVLSLDGQLAQSLQLTFNLSDWQPWLPAQSEGFWTGFHWAYRLPVFILYTAFVLTTFFWPAPKNLAHLIALSAAALVGAQFWYADHGGIYVLWYLPLVLLLMFRPNLSECFPEAVLDPNQQTGTVGVLPASSVQRVDPLQRPTVGLR